MPDLPPGARLLRSRASPTNIRTHLQTWCSAGWTSGQVKNRLIAQFGIEILASPPKSGFDLLAWVIPGAALAGGRRGRLGARAALARPARPAAAAAGHRRRDRRPHRRRPGGPRMSGGRGRVLGGPAVVRDAVRAAARARLSGRDRRPLDRSAPGAAGLAPVRARVLGGVHRPRSRCGACGRRRSPTTASQLIKLSRDRDRRHGPRDAGPDPRARARADVRPGARERARLGLVGAARRRVRPRLDALHRPGAGLDPDARGDGRDRRPRRGPAGGLRGRPRRALPGRRAWRSAG